MNVNIESASALRRKMTIEIEQDEIRRELDAAYNDLKRQVHLKGFRPGRAPRPLLERLFGDQIRGEVIQKLIKESTEKALADNSLSPVAAPEIITEESDLPSKLRFSAVFDVKPEIAIKDYADLKVPKPTVKIDEDEVGKALERLRERSAPIKKIEGRTTVQAGDLALVEIEGFENGKPIEGTKVEARLLEVSPETLKHGLADQLIGATAGQPVNAARSYPAEYEERAIAGKTVEWRTTVKEIFCRELPALDDEFAKDQGDCQTLDELRNRIREELTAQARREADARSRQALMDLIIERNPIEVPQSLVEREQNAFAAELEGTLEASGVPHEKAAESARQGREEFRAKAEKRVLGALVADALADQEKVEIGDDDLAERIGQLVTQSGRERNRAAEFYGRPESREALRQSMRREKTLDLLLNRAQTESACD